jgi:energy-coupling factor transporter ATP-binding protein EcfA2
MLNHSVQVGEQEDSEYSPSPLGGKLMPNPFPGLRPFTLDECHLFFGREGQIDQILLKLSQHRAVTVMGYSGSGKSSLMYCGLVPTLYGGFVTETGPNWKIVVARPGTAPIENLTNAILEKLLKDGKIQDSDKPIHRAIINSTLRNSSNGLVEITRYIQTRLGENIFFLIDQFEELFRYKDSKVENADNESLAFVNLILTTVNQTQVPAYLALNMRADFIGNCAAFPGLTELINKSNYLVPQMTREQKRMVIEGPVAVGGGSITQRLVKRLLNDIGDNQDQLPILQHALMRTWDYWVTNREPGEPMDLRHYNSVGQIAQALSLHANEAYDELNSQEKNVVEILFKAITEKSEENQGVRRPTKVNVIAELADVTDAEVIKVIEKFRQPGRSFLMPSYQVPLRADSVIELSHESLMRIWTRLSNWVGEEFESVRMYKRVSEASAMYQIGKTSLWRPPDLQLALNWQKKQNPTRVWAQRYDVAFERAIVFLDTSRITFEAELKNQEMLQRRMLRRARLTNIILGIALLVSIGFFFYGLINSNRVITERDRAIAQEKKAFIATKQALFEKNNAEKQTKIAVEKTNKLLEKERELLRSFIALREAKDQAQAQAIEAKRQEKNAVVARELEKAAKIDAEEKKAEATESFQKYNNLYYLTIAQSLEAKSVNIEEKQLAGLTAMQGYLFHAKYGGKKYDPYVFRGLYYSLAKLQGYNYNEVKLPGGLKSKMFALAVSQNSDRFYTSGSDGKIMQGNFITQKAENQLYENNGHPNRVLALSKDEKYLVNGSDSSQLEIFTLNDPNKTPMIVEGHKGSISDIKFLRDNAGFISASTDGTLRLTNQLTGESKMVLKLTYDLKSIDISPDGDWLAGASISGKLILVNLKDFTYKEIVDEGANRILSVAFNPANPSMLAYGVEVMNKTRVIRGAVKVLDIVSKNNKELTGHKAGITDLEFSPDGKLLASAGLDKKIQMWVVDFPDDLPIEMDNNNGNVWRLAFAKGSNYLIASCNNGEVRVWPTDTRALAEQVCPKLARNMSKEEWRIYVGNNIEYESTCRSLLIKDF